MGEVKWNMDEFGQVCKGATMGRLVKAAEAVRDEAKRILKPQTHHQWREHGPYKTGKYAGQPWTERYYDRMKETLRVVRKNDPSVRNVRIVMGNWKTWWAIQMEYGHGQWKGGARPTLRPALKTSAAAMRSAIENG